MNVLMQAPQTESKDIKLIDKKVLDTKSTDDKDFFENIISNIISDVEEGENKNFLLAKLLNLSSEFEKKEETISDFSQGTLFTDHQIEQISIQDLLKVAMLIKNNEDVATFPTDSQSLKLALTKPDVTEQFKDAKNIKDLLDIAKKNNIEVKNFQFFSESAALNPSDKKMVQQLKSEDIFKLIEKQIETKTEKTLHQLTHTNQVTQKSNQKVNILQTVLASKEVSKPLQKDQATSNTKSLPVTEEKIDVQTTIVKKEVKVTKTITNIETKEDTQPTKAVANENSESKKVTPIDNSLETKTEPTKNQKNSLENLLKTQHNESKKENVSNSVKIEPIREKVDIEAIETKESSDKTVVNHETKVQNVDKTKSTPDLKKTFTTFAEEFKEKVESYKPPLMKIKMELKPHGLGEVDVTLLNRGNNLQVNINSNANTIAMFAQNQVEFKNSLVNMGFSDLQMNFSEQQKKEQGQQKQQENKSSFEQFDETDEQDGFEMIVPQYV